MFSSIHIQTSEQPKEIDASSKKISHDKKQNYTTVYVLDHILKSMHRFQGIT